MSRRRYSTSPYKQKNRNNAILDMCIKFAEEKNLYASMKEAAKGAGLIGAASLVGSLLGGKKGMIAGSALGTAASYLLLDDFKSVAEIIQEMSQPQKQELVSRMETILRDVDIKDATTGLTYIAQNSTITKKVETQLQSFFENSMEMSITSTSSPFESSSFF